MTQPVGGSFPKYLRDRTPHEPPADSTEYDFEAGRYRELRNGAWSDWIPDGGLGQRIEAARAQPWRRLVAQPPWYARPWIVPTLASVALVLAVIGAIVKAWS